MNRRRRYAERNGWPTGVAANRKGYRVTDLAPERGHRSKWEIIHCKDLIADKMGRRIFALFQNG
jgi:hypothetical protein